MTAREWDELESDRGLSPEEIGLLKRIDPKFSSMRNLDKDLEKGYVKGMGYGELSAPTRQAGGFAIAPLLPLLGSLAGGVLPSLVSGLVGLFKKKGSGRRLKEMGAKGAGARMRCALNEMMPEMTKTEEKVLSSGSGAFWSGLRKGLHKYGTRALVKGYGLTPKLAAGLSSKITQKMIPRGVCNSSKVKAAGIYPTGAGAKNPYVTAGLPMMQYIGKSIGAGSSDAIKVLTDAFVEEAANKEGAGVQGGAAFLEKLKKFAKMALKKALPKLSEYIPHLRKYAQSGVENLIDKIFQWEPLQKVEMFKDPFKRATSKAFDYGESYVKQKLNKYGNKYEEPAELMKQSKTSGISTYEPDTELPREEEVEEREEPFYERPIPKSEKSTTSPIPIGLGRRKNGQFMKGYSPRKKKGSGTTPTGNGARNLPAWLTGIKSVRVTR